MFAPVVLTALLSAPLSGDPRVLVEAATDFPIQVGARAEVPLPSRLRLSGTIGFVPEPYVRLVNRIAVERGAYDRDTADLIERSLRDSLAAAVHLGWRPFPRLGLLISGGYGYLTLGATGTTAETLSVILGVPRPPVTSPGDRFDVRVSVHALHAEAGWRFDLEPITLRLAVGYAVAVSAPTRIDTEGGALTAASVAFEGDLESGLSDRVRRGFRFPTLSVSAGLAF